MDGGREGGMVDWNIFDSNYEYLDLEVARNYIVVEKVFRDMFEVEDRSWI